MALHCIDFYPADYAYAQKQGYARSDAVPRARISAEPVYAQYVEVWLRDAHIADAFSDAKTDTELAADKQMLLDLARVHFAGGA